MKFIYNSALFCLGVVLSGCAHQTGLSSVDPSDAHGFLFGLLHGAIALFTLTVSLFTDVRIYSIPNSGWLYDFGFVIGFLFCQLVFLFICVCILDNKWRTGGAPVISPIDGKKWFEPHLNVYRIAVKFIGIVIVINLAILYLIVIYSNINQTTM